MPAVQIDTLLTETVETIGLATLGPRGVEGVRWIGAWSSIVDYSVHDGVTYQGSSFTALTASTNVAPTAGASSAEWLLIAAKGDTGPSGGVGTPGPGLPSDGNPGDIPVKQSTTPFDYANVPAGDGAFLDVVPNGGPLVVTSDGRLADARVPTGAAGGDLDGSNYPNPVLKGGAVTGSKIQDGAVGTAKITDKAVTAGKIADDTITATQIAAGAVGPSEILDGSIGPTEVNPANVDGLAAAPSLRTLGTGAQQAAPGNTPALKAANLSDLTDKGAGRIALGLEARMEGVFPELYVYAHSYGVVRGAAGDIGGSLVPYIGRASAAWAYRVADRISGGHYPPYLNLRSIAAQRLAETVGVMLSGYGNASWVFTKPANPAIVILQALFNDRAYAQGTGTEQTQALNAYKEALRTAARLVRMDTKTDAAGVTTVGTWAEVADTTMASGGGTSNTSTGDVTTDYKQFPAPGSSEVVIIGACLNIGTGGTGILQARDGTTGTVLGEMSEADGFPHSIDPTPSFYQKSLRLTGVNPANPIRVGRKPGSGGTVYVDSMLTVRTDPPLLVVTKDANLVGAGAWWGGTGTAAWADQLRAGVDAVVAEAEFSPYVVASDPTSHGWDPRWWSGTLDNATNGPTGCIYSGDGVHPNEHGQLVIADAQVAAIAGSRWLNQLQKG